MSDVAKDLRTLAYDYEHFADDEVALRFNEAADRIDELEAERQHSLGCEHHPDPPHRCHFETCYRQWQADRIDELETEVDRWEADAKRSAGGWSDAVDRIDELEAVMRDIAEEYPGGYIARKLNRALGADE